MAKKKKPESTGKSGKRNDGRLPNGKFQPGCSGNPGGRPKMLPELREAARAHTAEAIDTLLEVMRNRKALASARVAAANAILDRGWGKPTQELAVDALVANVKASEKPFDEMSEAERTSLAQSIAFILHCGKMKKENGSCN